MERTRGDELKEVPLYKADPKSWPTGVRTIGQDELDCLGVDSEGVLYWNGRPVAVQKRITLSYWQTIGALTVSLFTILGAMGSATQGWVAACQAHLIICNYVK